MENRWNGTDIGEKAMEYSKNGYHCAEAVAAAVLEGLDQDPSLAAAHATPFGGGFGRTFDEACGALSGCLIVIGHLYGRRRPGGNWDAPAAMAKDIRNRFLERYETTHCATLRERFGPEQQAAECARLVKHVTVDLVELLSSHQAESV